MNYPTRSQTQVNNNPIYGQQNSSNVFGNQQNRVNSLQRNGFFGQQTANTTNTFAQKPMQPGATPNNFFKPNTTQLNYNNNLQMRQNMIGNNLTNPTQNSGNGFRGNFNQGQTNPVSIFGAVNNQNPGNASMINRNNFTGAQNTSQNFFKPSFMGQQTAGSNVYGAKLQSQQNLNSSLSTNYTQGQQNIQGANRNFFGNSTMSNLAPSNNIGQQNLIGSNLNPSQQNNLYNQKKFQNVSNIAQQNIYGPNNLQTQNNTMNNQGNNTLQN